MGHSVIKHLNEVGNERKVFFTESEIRLVIAGLPAYLKDFVLFAYITGMRKGEVQSLRWTDVHTDAITLRPENSKSVEARMIPLEGELAELIERCQIGRHFEKNGAVIISEYVFHDGGRPVGEFRKAGATAWLHAGFGDWCAPPAKARLMQNTSARSATRNWTARNCAIVDASCLAS